MTASGSDTVADSKTVATGAAVNLLGMLARGSRALFTLFVTRVSGPQIFGLFTLAVAVVDVVIRFTVFGMDKSLLKFIPEADGTPARLYRTLSSVFRIAIVLSSLAVAGLVWFAPWIANGLLHKPELGFPLRLMALSILPLTALTLALSATKALKIMSYDALVTGMLFPLVLLLFSVPIVWLDDDAVTLSLAYVVASAVAAIVAVWFFKRHFSLSRSVVTAPRDALRQVGWFSAPLGLHDFVQYVAIKIEIFILAFFVSPVELGVYALAIELAFVIKKFRQVFDPILIPVIAEAHRADQWPRVEENVARVARWILVLGAFYVGAMTLFARPILDIFGDAFARGAVPLVVLCVAHLLHATTGLLDTAMMVSGRPRVNLLNVCIVLVTQTGLNLWLIPQFGMLGAALAALVSFMLIGVIRLGQSLWILRLNPFSLTQVKPLLAGLGATLPILALQQGGWLANGSFAWVGLLLAFGVMYVASLKLLGLEDEDRQLLRRLMSWRKAAERDHPVESG